MGAWIIVIAGSGGRSRRKKGVGEVAGECSDQCDANEHRDRPGHLAGIGHWIYVAVSDSRNGGHSPPQRLGPGEDVGAWRTMLDSEHEHAAELHRRNGEKGGEQQPALSGCGHEVSNDVAQPIPAKQTTDSQYSKESKNPQQREATDEIEPAAASEEIPRLDGGRNKSNREVDQENRRKRDVDNQDQLLHLSTDR